MDRLHCHQNKRHRRCVSWGQLDFHLLSGSKRLFENIGLFSSELLWQQHDSSWNFLSHHHILSEELFTSNDTVVDGETGSLPLSDPFCKQMKPICKSFNFRSRIKSILPVQKVKRAKVTKPLSYQMKRRLRVPTLSCLCKKLTEWTHSGDTSCDQFQAEWDQKWHKPHTALCQFLKSPSPIFRLQG